VTSQYISTLLQEFNENADSIKAPKMEAYMKNKFSMFGINAPLRNAISKPFLQKESLPPKNELPEIVKTLWDKPQREIHYFALELMFNYAKQFEKHDIELLEYMLTRKSWWDTVDFIAAKLLGTYFRLYPEQILPITSQWLSSENIWLQRSCLLFQLKYKTNVDTLLLSQIINQLNHTNTFFINKAIGWVLREYAKTDPAWVINFVQNTPLSNLSKKEALKHFET